MAPTKTTSFLAPLARVQLFAHDSVDPGWYVQHYAAGRLTTTRLQLPRGADASDAAVEAAAYLGCPTSRVQLGGPEWRSRPVQLRLKLVDSRKRRQGEG